MNAHRQFRGLAWLLLCAVLLLAILPPAPAWAYGAPSVQSLLAVPAPPGHAILAPAKRAPHPPSGIKLGLAAAIPISTCILGIAGQTSYLDVVPFDYAVIRLRSGRSPPPCLFLP